MRGQLLDSASGLHGYSTHVVLKAVLQQRKKQRTTPLGVSYGKMQSAFCNNNRRCRRSALSRSTVLNSHSELTLCTVRDGRTTQ